MRKGKAMANMIEIDSLAEYLQNIEQFGDKYYFRGEAKNFKETSLTASAYRELESSKSSDIIMLRERYYHEIGYVLSRKDIENFIAYAQHHGLPTELIDITNNPLVALYFACSDFDEDDGYVYSVNSEQTVNLDKLLITEDISKQKLDFNFEYKWFKNTMFNENIEISKEVERIFLDMSLERQKLFDYLKSHVVRIKKSIDKYNMSDENYYPIDILRAVHSEWGGLFLNSNWNSLAENINSEICDAIIKGDINSFKNTFANEKYKELFSEHFQNIDHYGRQYTLNESFALFVFSLVVDLVIDPLGNVKSTGIRDLLSSTKVDFPPLKYLLHRPSVIFDRMRNQEAIFIYQVAVETCGINNEKVVIQSIIPEITYKVSATNKKKVLKQLDKIGINQKFIYPDPDNIASYVKNNWNDKV